MILFSQPSEVWVDLKYRYKGEDFQFNLPLTLGVKFLDGVRLDFSFDDIDGGRRLKLVLEPLGTIRLESLVVTGNLPLGDDLKSVFVNGYQSRTGSRERSPGERISALNWPGRLLGMQLPGDDRFHHYTERKGCFHGYTYTYSRYPGALVFSGSLDEDSGFTIMSIDVRRELFAVRKDVEGLVLDSMRTMLDLVVLEGSEQAVFRQYRSLRGDKIRTGPRGVAWSTGRENRGSLDEVKIRRWLAGQRNAGIPLTSFVIDDGWQSHTGDWHLPASGFPSGMASLATEIRGSGYIPGIRFAPFLVGPESSIFRTRKEWLVRDSRKRIRAAKRSGRDGGLLFALDLGRDDVKDYLVQAMERFRDEWGFGLVRADDLYAAAVYPPEGKSRGEIMTEAMNLLFENKGDLLLEASGIPLGSAFGRTEYCRVAADTIPAWEDYFRRNIHGRERASTLNALRSTVGRRQLNGLFFSSSVDGFRLVDSGNSIEPSRRYTQLIVQYLLGTLITTADDIGSYTPEQRRLYESLFPVADPDIDSVVESRRTVTIRYAVGDREYICIANLAERHRPFMLPDGLWFGAAGLKRRPHHLIGGSPQMLRPGESRNYMKLRDDGSGDFAGSDGHLLPGCEISSISRRADGWRVEPAAGVSRSFRIWLHADGSVPPRINGKEAETVPGPAGMVFLSGAVTPDRTE